ncbi:MAG: hypothetical protein AAF960_11225 [Bacteroidota bacterium]
MANIFNSENLKNDYTDFKAEIFKTNRFVVSRDFADTTNFKKFHHLIYAIALIHTKCQQNWPKSPNRHAYIGEIRSDALAFSCIVLQGYKQSGMILLRRIIENFYNQVYFFEHPVEFELLNLGKNEYTPLNGLKNYLQSHPVFIERSSFVKDYNESIYKNYQFLCKTVHTKGISFMGLAKNLKELKRNSEVERNFKIASIILEAIIFILYKFHCDLSYSNSEKMLISKLIPKEKRSALHN